MSELFEMEKKIKENVKEDLSTTNKWERKWQMWISANRLQLIHAEGRSLCNIVFNIPWIDSEWSSCNNFGKVSTQYATGVLKDKVGLNLSWNALLFQLS